MSPSARSTAWAGEASWVPNRTSWGVGSLRLGVGKKHSVLDHHLLLLSTEGEDCLPGTHDLRIAVLVGHILFQHVVPYGTFRFCVASSGLKAYAAMQNAIELEHRFGSL